MKKSNIVWKKKDVTLSDLHGLIEDFEYWNNTRGNPNFLKEDSTYREKFDDFRQLFRSVYSPYYQPLPQEVISSYREFVAYHKWRYLQHARRYGLNSFQGVERERQF